MKLTRYEYLKSSLNVFSFSILQDANSVIRSLSEYDIELSEFAEYIIENQKLFSSESAKGSIAEKAFSKYCHCPECGSGVTIEKINYSQCSVLDEKDKNGNTYLSMATCKQERICGWQVFSTLHFEMLIRSFFPDSINESIEELTVQPHGIDSF